MLGQREQKTAEQNVSQAAEMRPVEAQVVRYWPDELVLKLQSRRRMAGCWLPIGGREVGERG